MRAGGPGPAGEQEAPSKGGGGRNSALQPTSCHGGPERQAGSGLASQSSQREGEKEPVFHKG